MTMTLTATLPPMTALLAGMELFAGVTAPDLERVARNCVNVQVQAGHELCHEGQQAREFVVILDGEAVVTVDGRPTAHLGAGSCFGEMALVDGHNRTATVSAHTDMDVVVFDGDDFRALLEEVPVFTMRVLGVVIGRLRLANSQLAQLSGRSRSATRSPSQSSGPDRLASRPSS